MWNWNSSRSSDNDTTINYSNSNDSNYSNKNADEIREKQTCDVNQKIIINIWESFFFHFIFYSSGFHFAVDTFFAMRLFQLRPTFRPIMPSVYFSTLNFWLCFMLRLHPLYVCCYISSVEMLDMAKPYAPPSSKIWNSNVFLSHETTTQRMRHCLWVAAAAAGSAAKFMVHYSQTNTTVNGLCVIHRLLWHPYTNDFLAVANSTP